MNKITKVTSLKHQSDFVRHIFVLVFPALWWLSWLTYTVICDDTLDVISEKTTYYIVAAAILFSLSAVFVAIPRLKVPRNHLPTGHKPRLGPLYIAVNIVNGLFAIRSLSMYTIHGALIRSAVFEYNADLFFSTWIHVIYQYTIYPLTVYACFLGVAASLLSNRIIWLALSLLTAGLADLVYFGRFNIYTAFLAFMLGILLINNTSEASDRVLNRRRRSLLGLAAFALTIPIAGNILISNARDGAVLQVKNEGYLNQFSRYHTIGLHLFDKQINGESLPGDELGWGRCTFGGLDVLIGILIRRFDDSYEPLSRAIDQHRQLPVNISRELGAPEYVNAFYTGFSSGVHDFGLTASLPLMIGYGALFGFAYANAIINTSVMSCAMWIYLSSMLSRFLFNSPVEAPFFWIVLLILWVSERNSRAAAAARARG